MPDSVQLNYRNWPNVVALLKERIAEANLVRRVDTYGDHCGESGPFIELTILCPDERGSIVAKHGDWITREPNGNVTVRPHKPHEAS
jgi:hypothetical protein